MGGARPRRRVAAGGRVVVVDSLVAARLAPAVLLQRPPWLAALVHQRPGGTAGSAARQAGQRRLDVAVYRRCGALVAVSPELAAELVDVHGLPRDRVRVVEPGSDLPPAAPMAGLRRGARLAAVDVASWLPNKGILEVLAAVASLPRDDVVLHLAGRRDADPAYTRAVEARLQHPDLRGRVVVHGPLAPKEVAALLAGADVFVFASRAESYGTVFAEALWSGLPIVAWPAGALRRLLGTSGAGVIVEPGDVTGLAAALARAAAEPGWLAALKAAAVRQGATLPHWEGTARGVFSALRALAAAQPGGAPAAR